MSKPPSYGWDEVDRNIETTIQGSHSDWVDRVNSSGEWDYKEKKEDEERHPWSERERMGNVNYGATCVAVGHDPDLCLRAGGAFQGYSDWNNDHEPFVNSSGRPWDLDGTSCYGEPADDCQQVIEGIRYGLDYLNRTGRRR
ncbi:MAG: hypothetical protein HQL57_07570 [Magnetococcales bacterium]|nr:hypothetical protein [Magnetococcales bacterium]